MKYRILYQPATEKQFRRIAPAMRQKIRMAISALADDPRPHGFKKLVTRDQYRIRVGDYRVIYEIHDRTVTVVVVEVGNRRDIYR